MVKSAIWLLLARKLEPPVVTTVELKVISLRTVLVRLLPKAATTVVRAVTSVGTAPNNPAVTTVADTVGEMVAGLSVTSVATWGTFLVLAHKLRVGVIVSEVTFNLVEVVATVVILAATAVVPINPATLVAE